MYLLDTNIVSRIIRRDCVPLQERLSTTPMSQISISAITEAEMLYGLEKKPSASKLKRDVTAILARVNRLPWTTQTALAYAVIRSQSESSGIAVGNLDLLIASHALETGRTLVTNDSAIHRLRPWLDIVDWTLNPPLV